jgi:hypothetical protein
VRRERMYRDWIFMLASGFLQASLHNFGINFSHSEVLLKRTRILSSDSLSMARFFNGDEEFK